MVPVRPDERIGVIFESRLVAEIPTELDSCLRVAD
jgi:hypothetical protein